MDDDDHGATTQILQEALLEADKIEKMLDEFENTKNKTTLSEVTAKMKIVTGQLRELSANPKAKTKENSPLLQKLSSKMKDMLIRTKALTTGIPASASSQNQASTPNRPPSSIIDPQAKSKSDPGSRKSQLLDSTKGPPPLKGWLKKQGEDLFKGWKKRYFQQSGPNLYYFVDEKDDQHSGSIDLEQVERVDISSNIQFDLITTQRVFHLQTVPDKGKEKEEMDYWVDGITNYKKFVTQKKESHR